MFDDSIDVLTYPTTTDRGRIIPDYTATPTSVSVSGVDLQPGASTELIAQQREGVAVRWTVYVPSERIPAGVVVTAKSIVRVGVDVYQVNGEPMSWAGDLRHIVVALVDWAA